MLGDRTVEDPRGIVYGVRPGLITRSEILRTKVSINSMLPNFDRGMPVFSSVRMPAL